MALSNFFDDTELSFDVQLLDYIKEKNNKKAECILLHEKDLDKIIDASGSSLLHYAAEFGNKTIASYLIKLRSKVNLQNKVGDTSLLLATKGQHATTIKLLLESDADMNICNNEDDNPLKTALQLSPMNVEIAKIFLDRLIRDCYSKSAEIAKRLMKNNCPLYVAVLARNPAVVKYMLNRGWPINARDPSSGKTALHVAVENLDLKLVKLLLQFGADVNAADALNRTPLAMLHSFDDSSNATAILQRLLDARPEVTSCSHDGFMQMHCILKDGTPEAVERMLKYRFDMSMTDVHKQNILHYLAKNVNEEEVFDHIYYNFNKDDILEKVDGNARDEDGSTPLHYAMNVGNAEFVFHFCETLERNIANNKGVTPFLQAIQSTSVPIKKPKRPHHVQTRLRCVEYLMMTQVNPEILLVQYFSLYDTNSAIARHVTLLEPVVAMLAALNANGKPINQGVLNRIRTYPQLKKYFNLCTIVVDKLKREMINKDTSLFDYVVFNKHSMNLSIISSFFQSFRIRYKLEKYKSIPIYHHILFAHMLTMSGCCAKQYRQLIIFLVLFIIYKSIFLYLYYNGNVSDLTWYPSNFFLFLVSAVSTFVIFILFELCVYWF